MAGLSARVALSAIALADSTGTRGGDPYERSPHAVETETAVVVPPPDPGHQWPGYVR